MDAEAIRNLLLNQMGSDLGVFQFCSESKDEYVCRVIYSAMSCWLKTLCFEQSENRDVDDLFVTGNFLISKGVEVLEQYIEIFPALIPWMRETTPTEVVSIIRKSLRKNEEIFVPVGKENRFTLCSPQSLYFSEEWVSVKGVLLDKGCFYSGVGVLKNRGQRSENPNILLESSVDWLYKITKELRWETVSEIGEGVLEFFDSKRKNCPNYRCWQKELCWGKSEFLLARCKKAAGTRFEYFLYKRVRNRIKVAQIPPFLIDIKEHRRFMFALRSLSDNPPIAFLICESDSVNLELTVKLPGTDGKFLEVFAWPSKGVGNKLNFVMLPDVWEQLERRIKALGITVLIKEKNK